MAGDATPFATAVAVTNKCRSNFMGRIKPFPADHLGPGHEIEPITRKWYQIAAHSGAQPDRWDGMA
jgi:hypothetical protein